MALSVATQEAACNEGTIAVARNPVSHNRTKHIDIKFHYVREALEDGIIDLMYCPTKQMTADILTKPLARQQFETFRLKMGLKNMPQFKWECCNSKLTLCTYEYNLIKTFREPDLQRERFRTFYRNILFIVELLVKLLVELLLYVIQTFQLTRIVWVTPALKALHPLTRLKFISPPQN